MLNLDHCRQRQTRLRHLLDNHNLPTARLANPKLIYYFTGAPVDPLLPHLFHIDSGGRTTLITFQQPHQAATDQVQLYTSYTIDKPFNRSTQIEEIYQMLGSGPAGIDADWLPCRLAPDAAVDITPALDEMRRLKDPDELDSIRDTVRLTEAGYTAVKEPHRAGDDRVSGLLNVPRGTRRPRPNLRGPPRRLRLRPPGHPRRRSPHLAPRLPPATSTFWTSSPSTTDTTAT